MTTRGAPAGILSANASRTARTACGEHENKGDIKRWLLTASSSESNSTSLLAFRLREEEGEEDTGEGGGTGGTMRMGGARHWE